MSDYQKFLSLHAADLPQTGFDYQFYCYIYFLLTSEQLVEVVYEREDDIDVIEDDEINLIQVKHSVDATAALTDLDGDLWKTIKNWLDQWELYDKDSSHTEPFTKKHRLTLLTNKKLQCAFLDKVRSYKTHDEDEASIRSYLQSLSSKQTDVQDGITALKNLSLADFKWFLNHFEAACFPDALECLYNQLRKQYPTGTKTNNVLYQLIGKLHTEKYNAAIKRYKLRYVRKDFDREFRTIFVGPNPNLPDYVTELDESVSLPADYADLMLFKQLVMIEEVDITNLSDANIPHIYALYLHYIRNIGSFISGELADDTYVRKLENNAFQAWQRIFDSCKRKINRYRGNDKAAYEIDMGSECYSETMKHPVQSFDYNFSNGCFYKLSNDSCIGWHNNWESLK